ncbi:NnrS family protein [Belnapia rosea]|uniref:NnrS family protein n=1 Tax=Belnapia rosea TaxID=938405 RepID=UPI00088ADE93|nr:NnrS family protein [Belnapia rosea]SDB74309.1 uncharacterized protein involved in response to NO [Belnapia rosea]
MSNSTAPHPATVALFEQGFRPFFLLAGLWAVFAMALWVMGLYGAGIQGGPLPLARWHGHEMLMGFVGAAMGGFLLTAIPNWTKGPVFRGVALMLVAALFVAARLVLLPGSPVPPGLAAAIGLLPLPALLLLVLPALIKAGTLRIFGPPALILTFWTGDLLMLGDAAGWWQDTFAAGELLALDIALVLVGIIGGRIIPVFTRNALRHTSRPVEPTPLPGVDTAGIAALLAVVIVDLIRPGGTMAGVVAAIAAGLALLRLSRWHGMATLRQPILWVLHFAYLMVPIALAVKAAHLLGGANWAENWFHLQAIGAVALMILAVMPRATLGHTGRPLMATPGMIAAWLLIPAAAVVRAFGPVVMSGTATYAAAAAFWILAFGLFLGAHGPMLLWARPDGEPG